MSDMELENGDMIDNEEIYLVDVLKHELPTTKNLKILVGYLFFSGFTQVSEEIKTVDTIDIVMGTDTDDKTIGALGDAHDAIPPSKFVKIVKEGLDKIKSDDEWDMVDYLKEMVHNHRMDIHVYIKAKFHPKIYIFERENPAENTVIGGSANLSIGGTEKNIENLYYFNTQKQYDQHMIRYHTWKKDSEEFNLKFLNLIQSHPKYKEFKKKKEEAKPDAEFQYLTPVNYYRYLIEQLGKDYLFGHVDHLIPFQRVDYRIAKSVINRYGGVILASSVGMGKSYVALQIVKDYDKDNKKILFIFPPNIRDQWGDYLLTFDIDEQKPNIHIITHWDISQKEFDPSPYTDFDCIVVDESHNFRNTNAGRLTNFLKLKSNNPNADYILLTATPINNNFVDLYNQVKMMYSEKFKTDELIDEYNNLGEYADSISKRRAKKDNEKTKNKSLLLDSKKIKYEEMERERTDALQKIKNLRKKLIVRSTRSDLTEEDKEFLKKKLKVSELNLDPPILETKNYVLDGRGYDLLFKHLVPFISSLELPHIILINPKAGEFIASIYRIILYKRFESSIHALCVSLNNLEHKNNQLITMLEKGLPINNIRGDEGNTKLFKKLLANQDEIDIDDMNEFDYINDEMVECQHCHALISHDEFTESDECPTCKEIIEVKDELSLNHQKYITMAKEDLKRIQFIKTIITNGIQIGEMQYTDAKIEILYNYIKDNRNKKILVFSQFTDTVMYLHKKISELQTDAKPIRFVHGQTHRKMEHAILFSPSFYSKSYKAKFIEKYHLAKDYFDEMVPTSVLIATDTFSEGMNLQEADIIINYDLPWNPVRLAQRIGRAYRIDNAKVVRVLNILPDSKIDNEVNLISILKTKISNIIIIIGSEHCLLTNDEKSEIDKKIVDDLDIWKKKMDERKSRNALVMDMHGDRMELSHIDEYLIDIIENQGIQKSSHKITIEKDKMPYTILPNEDIRYLLLLKVNKLYDYDIEMVIVDQIGTEISKSFPNENMSFETIGAINIQDNERKQIKNIIEIWKKSIRKEKIDRMHVSPKDDLSILMPKIFSQINGRFNKPIIEMDNDIEMIRKKISKLSSILWKSSVLKIHQSEVFEFRRKWFENDKSNWIFLFNTKITAQWKRDDIYEEKMIELCDDLENLLNNINKTKQKKTRAKDLSVEVNGFIIYRDESVEESLSDIFIDRK